MSVFELNPSCLVLSSGGDNTKTTTMSNQNEYYQLLFPVMDVNSQEFGNGISYDSTNSADRWTVASDGTFDVNGNLDANAGLDVTGNITVTGTVDGRDVATDGTKLDGIETGATADQTAAEIKHY